MAYTQEKKDEWFDYIISEIESGKSLISALRTNGAPSTSTFYIWLEEKDQDGVKTLEAEEKSKRYACACEARELMMLDEILEIADDQEDDIIIDGEKEYTNHNVIQRSKVRIEARQWVLGKLRPEKYGNKVDLTSGNKPLASAPPAIIFLDTDNAD